MHHFVLSFVVASFGSFRFAQEMDQGHWVEKMEIKDAYISKDPAVLRPITKGGNSFAQFNLGLMYHEGCGVEQSGSEAAKWYHKAAEQEHEKAKSALEALHTVTL